MSFQLQKKIKQNAQEIKNYMTGLYDWQQQMNMKQKMKKQFRKQEQQNRNEKQKQIQLQQKSNHQEIKQNHKIKQLFRDQNSVSQYYNAWNKYDIDSQILKLEQQQLAPYRPYNPYENSKNNIRAKPKTKMTISNHRKNFTVQDPNELKDKGNLHFKVCDYQRAIESYSECLDKLKMQNLVSSDQLKCIVLSNRGMAYMKLNEIIKAIQDCSESIQLNKNYLKSYLRRGQCYRRLGRFNESLQDYKKVQNIDKQDKQSEIQIKRIQTQLQKQYNQARNYMIIDDYPKVIANSERISIVEVQTINENVKKQNYLEQL